MLNISIKEQSGNSNEYTIDLDKKEINGQPDNWDIVKIKNGWFHIIKDKRSYECHILKTDFTTKTMTVEVSGAIFEVNIKDKYDLLLKELGMEALTSAKINEIKAPMPGLVLEIHVKKGDELLKGDSVLVLEAMKMQNTIKSPGDGKIKSIEVTKGQAVEKNQVLIKFE